MMGEKEQFSAKMAAPDLSCTKPLEAWYLMHNPSSIKNFSEYKDIYDWYNRTGMSRLETFNFLLSELEKLRNGAVKT